MDHGLWTPDYGPRTVFPNEPNEPHELNEPGLPLNPTNSSRSFRLVRRIALHFPAFVLHDYVKAKGESL